MKRKTKILTLFFIACLAGFAHADDAAAQNIDFETYPAGTEIIGQYATLLGGVTFDSICADGATQVTTVMDNAPTTSGSNFLAPCGPGNNIGGTLILDFTLPVTEVSAYVVHDDAAVHVSAYDANDNLLDETWSDGSPVGFDRITVSGSGIKSVEMVGGDLPSGNPDGWGIDDLAFSSPVWEAATAEASTLGVTDVSSSNQLNTLAALLVPVAAVFFWRGVRRRKR